MDTENKPKRQKPVEVQCLNCGQRFFKKVSEILKSNHDFCCRGCAISYLNTVAPKRKKPCPVSASSAALLYLAETFIAPSAGRRKKLSQKRLVR
jgi:hypothetical protein